MYEAIAGKNLKDLSDRTDVMKGKSPTSNVLITAAVCRMRAEDLASCTLGTWYPKICWHCTNRQKKLRHSSSLAANLTSKSLGKGRWRLLKSPHSRDALLFFGFSRLKINRKNRVCYFTRWPPYHRTMTYMRRPK